MRSRSRLESVASAGPKKSWRTDNAAPVAGLGAHIACATARSDRPPLSIHSPGFDQCRTPPSRRSDSGTSFKEMSLACLRCAREAIVIGVGLRNTFASAALFIGAVALPSYTASAAPSSRSVDIGEALSHCAEALPLAKNIRQVGHLTEGDRFFVVLAGIGSLQPPTKRETVQRVQRQRRFVVNVSRVRCSRGPSRHMVGA